MKAMLCATALALGFLALPEAKAQVIRAEVIIGVPWVSVHRYAPRVIVVDRHRRGRGYYQHHGRDYRTVHAWYDRDRAAYYDGYRPGLREVTVYLRDGRYYGDYEADYRGDDRRFADRSRDRYADRDDRYDD